MATTQWILAFDRRPGDRSVRDVELICGRLRRLEALSRLPQQVIAHLAHHAFYEDVERGVTLFRQGDIGTSWYMILAGKVEVRAIQDKIGQYEIASISGLKSDPIVDELIKT
ncbi:rap guanine nucleotide exchange factor 4-like [Halyomorpha halys]|uniref:rap guanine nucleotide exchange factor 4-like n=1 Tax=Halyomorpha halys TaxID=286706 RepID=UPI0034D18319